jgi:ABC-type branched-subunit amino acid transport system ATPase component/ABC-type branched-subunit amino acid transport system permease subunit
VYIAAAAISPNAPTALVIVIACVAGAVTGGLSELLLSPLRTQPLLIVGTASLGVLLIAQGIVEWKWGYQARSVHWLSSAGVAFHVPGGSISGQQLASLVIAVVAVALVYVLVERTKYGLALRMSSSGPITAQLLGVNIWRTRQTTWVIGGALGGIAALLLSALTYLDPYNFTSFLIVAFVATVLGGFTNFLGVALGGVVLGVLLNILEIKVSTQLTQTYLLIIVAVVLVIRPNGLLGKPERLVPEPELPRARRRYARRPLPVPGRPRAGRSPEQSSAGSAWQGFAGLGGRGAGMAVLAALAVILLALPFVSSAGILALLPSAMATFIAVLGLNVIVGYTGQLTVGHSAFMAVGAYGAAIAADRFHIPALLSLPIGLAFGLVVGLVVGLPVGRLTGVFLSIVTIMLPFVADELALEFPGVTGGIQGLTYALPGWLFAAKNQYWFGLCIAAVCTVAVWALRRSPLGQRWIAVRDAPSGAQSIGISPAAARLSAFSIGCGLAALGGSLDAGFVGSVNPDSFTAWLSIYLLSALIIGGSGNILGCLLGSFFIVLVPQAVSGTAIPPDLLFGVALLVVMMLSPRGLTDLLRRLGEWAAGAVLSRTHRAVPPGPREEPAAPRAEYPTVTEPVAVPETNSHGRPAPGARPVLELRDVRAGYGQTSVLQGVDLAVSQGDVTALIGANGAGKTTLLRAISGLIPLRAGDVLFKGASIAGRSPAEISRLGIAHVPEGRGVFPDLSVIDNLQAARFCEPDKKPDIDQGLTVFPQLKRLLKRTAGTLSGGEQQMLAVARALAAHPTLLMLDEPSLGLSPKASKDLFAALGQLKGSSLTVLLIEQNAHAAIGLADTCCLFAHGTITNRGPASEFEDDHMVAAYLGVELL